MYNQQFQPQGNSQQGFQRQYQPVGNVQSFYGNNNQQQQYQTANYRGNQLGHDAGLRGDSFSPTQQGGGAGQNVNSASYGIRGNQQAYSSNNNVSQQFGYGNPYGSSQSAGSFNQSSYGQSSAGQSSNPSANSFHTANYRGNQLGHDAGLRGDSFSPTQQGGSASQGVNYSSASYGIRGNQQANSSNNNVSQQFGFNNPF